MFNYNSNYQVPTQTIQIIIYDRCSNLRDEKKCYIRKTSSLVTPVTKYKIIRNNGIKHLPK